MIMDDSLRAVRRALIIFLAAVLVKCARCADHDRLPPRSRGHLPVSVIGGLLVAALVSWILGSRILRRDRKAQRLVIGPLVVLGCAAVISLTWLYPGTGGVRPDPVAGVEWLDLPDGSRLALHVTRAAAATQPPIIFVTADRA
jgi:ABC-type branched-subunit amino acid transport system permease subunit